MVIPTVDHLARDSEDNGRLTVVQVCPPMLMWERDYRGLMFNGQNVGD